MVLVVCNMNAPFLQTCRVFFSFGIATGALLIFLDIRRYWHRAQPGTLWHDQPWTMAAAFVFDLVLISLCIAGIVGTSVVLSWRLDRVEAWWLDAGITCHLQLLVGNYVRT